MRSEPRSARTPVWPLSISLAATLEIDKFSFSSSPYLDVSVQAVPFHTLWIGVWMYEVCSYGFPHSEICGSRDICSSPQLFAAYHVFHRLSVPRHPPCALFCLTSYCFNSVWNRVCFLKAFQLLNNYVYVWLFVQIISFDILCSRMSWLKYHRYFFSILSVWSFQGTILTESLSVIRNLNLLNPLITGKISYFFVDLAATCFPIPSPV